MERDFTITQGKTFDPIVRWGARPHLYKAIASVLAQAPLRVTTQATHGIPEGWPCALVSLEGMTEANGEVDPDTGMPVESAYHKATVVSTTVVEFDDINGADFSAHVANSGYIQLYTPVDLAGYTARMTIKDKVGGTVLLALTGPVALNTEGIVIDTDAHTIQIVIPAATSEDFTWRRGVYDLELVEAGGARVHEVLRGRISVSREVTT